MDDVAELERTLATEATGMPERKRATPGKHPKGFFTDTTVCNGCGYCIVGCPFGVIDRREEDGRAWKCTLCYDRLKDDMTPACAKACPTDSIQFGDLDELKERARQRVEELHDRGVGEAYLYGVDEANQPGTEG